MWADNAVGDALSVQYRCAFVLEESVQKWGEELSQQRHAKTTCMLTP